MRAGWMWATLLSGMLFAGVLQARDTGINVLMTEIGSEMTALYPLMYAERDLTKAEIEEVTARLERMSVLFVQVEPQIKDRPSTYEISYDFIKPYLSDVVRAFKTNKIDYARNRLHGVSAICTSCHTQDTHLRTMFKGTKREAFTSDYIYAEFNYLTRNYQQAEIFYDIYLRSDDKRSDEQVLKSLQRIINVYTQIYNRPGDGMRMISQYKDRSDFSKETKNALNGWISGLAALEKSGVTSVREPDFKTLEGYVRQFLGDLDQPLSELYLAEDEQISRVWLRGQLYHYLSRNPKPDEIPKVLFWLSICDRSVGYNFYFPLADMYLKNCVVNYPRHPYASKCYAEYKEFITNAYTGSAGTFLPVEIEDELFELKRILKSRE